LSERPALDPRPLGDLLDLGAGSDLVQELIVLYEADVPPRLVALQKSLAAPDLRQALQVAHELKGALGNLGLARFADLVTRVEACVQAGQLPEAAQVAEALPAAYAEALQALRRAFPGT
jgi:HPt (histidine-containing phosphotransfer) domain-containing protein